MLYVFRQELQGLRVRITHLSTRPASEFLNAGFACIGIGLTGVVSLITFYQADPSRPSGEGTVLWCITVAGFGIALTCFAAARVFRKGDRSARDELLAEIDRIEYQSPSAAALRALEQGEDVSGDLAPAEET
jgi:hypothetical protein